MWTHLFCLALFVIQFRIKTDVQAQMIIMEPCASTCSLQPVREQVSLSVGLNPLAGSVNHWPIITLECLEADVAEGVCVNAIGNEVCRINLTQDGCQGKRLESCGYCDDHSNGIYHLKFNITAHNVSNYARYRSRRLGLSQDFCSQSLVMQAPFKGHFRGIWIIYFLVLICGVIVITSLYVIIRSKLPSYDNRRAPDRTEEGEGSSNVESADNCSEATARRPDYDSLSTVYENVHDYNKLQSNGPRAHHLNVAVDSIAPFPPPPVPCLATFSPDVQSTCTYLQPQ